MFPGCFFSQLECRDIHKKQPLLVAMNAWSAEILLSFIAFELHLNDLSWFEFKDESCVQLMHEF